MSRRRKLTKKERRAVCQAWRKRCEALEKEVQTYRNAARLYGVDAGTMLALAKSQIKTCADNIRLVEKMQEVLSVFDAVPDDLDADRLCKALAQWGEGEQPCCELVLCGLAILHNYLLRREEWDAWRKGNLPIDSL